MKFTAAAIFAFAAPLLVAAAGTPTARDGGPLSLIPVNIALNDISDLTAGPAPSIPNAERLRRGLHLNPPHRRHAGKDASSIVFEGMKELLR
jgi:hypothetical protein